MTGQTENGAMAAGHVAALKRMPPEVVHATGLFSDGELTLAESIVRAYLLKHGNDIEAMRLLARIGIERDVLDDAELLLEAVLDARAGLPGRPPRLRPGAAAAAQVPPGSRGAREAAAARARQRGVPRRCTRTPASVSASMTGRCRCTANCWPARRGRRTCTCRSRIASRPSADGRRPSRPTAPPRPRAPISAMPTGVWRISRPIASRTRRSRACSAEEAAPATPLVDRYHLCFALGKALGGSRRVSPSPGATTSAAMR